MTLEESLGRAERALAAGLHEEARSALGDYVLMLELGDLASPEMEARFRALRAALPTWEEAPG